MPTHTWLLLLILAVSIGALIFLINSRLRMHPFVALIVVSIGAGLASGEPIGKLAKAIEKGAGDTLGKVGLTLALGAMLGRLLSDSGATDRIAGMILQRSSKRSLPWFLTAAAFVIGIPMFFEVGLIILLPLIFNVASRLAESDEGAHGRQNSPYVLLGVPVIAALSTLHGMLPPHPGPLVAVSGLHADLGMTILVGVVCAIPAIIVAGPLYGRWLAPRLADLRPDPELLSQFTRTESESPGETGSGIAVRTRAGTTRVPTTLAVATVLVPVLLMLLRTVAEVLLGKSSALRQVLEFTGDPVVAMLAGFLFALAVLGLRSGTPGQDLRIKLGESLKPTAGILMIIAGGGAFNEVLEESGIGKAVASAAAGVHLNVLVLGWLLALLLSVSTGSATVGIVAATGIAAPLVGAGGDLHTSLLVVAIGAGSVGLNYVNHAGFWLVKESFGMSLGQATKSHTVVQTLVSVAGLIMTLLLSALA